MIFTEQRISVNMICLKTTRKCSIAVKYHIGLYKPC